MRLKFRGETACRNPAAGQLLRDPLGTARVPALFPRAGPGENVLLDAKAKALKADRRELFTDDEDEIDGSEEPDKDDDGQMAEGDDDEGVKKYNV